MEYKWRLDAVTRACLHECVYAKFRCEIFQKLRLNITYSSSNFFCTIKLHASTHTFRGIVVCSWNHFTCLCLRYASHTFFIYFTVLLTFAIISRECVLFLFQILGCSKSYIWYVSAYAHSFFICFFLFVSSNCAKIKIVDMKVFQCKRSLAFQRSKINCFGRCYVFRTQVIQVIIWTCYMDIRFVKFAWSSIEKHQGENIVTF